MFGKRLVHILEEAVFPSKCLICDSIIERKENYRNNRSKREWFIPETSGKDLKSRMDAAGPSFNFYFHDLLTDMACPACAVCFTPIHSPMCPGCGVVFESNAVGDHPCESCIREPKRFGMARAFGVYDRSLMELIHGFKYRGKIQLAYAFGVMLLLTFLRYWSKGDIDIIIPVPLHKRRFQKRGFNQSYLLIKAWEKFQSQSFRLPTVEKAILLRKRWTEPQTGLGRKDRIKNIKDAFAVYDSAKIRQKHILLVDDVYTTGATADECSKTLLSSGAEQVDVLTLARAL